MQDETACERRFRRIEIRFDPGPEPPEAPGTDIGTPLIGAGATLGAAALLAPAIGGASLAWGPWSDPKMKTEIEDIDHSDSLSRVE